MRSFHLYLTNEKYGEKPVGLGDCSKALIHYIKNKKSRDFCQHGCFHQLKDSTDCGGSFC